MNRGIIRRLDTLGRPVLPKEYRTILGLNTGDEVEMTLNDDAIIIKKKQKMYDKNNYIILNDVKYHKDYIARLIREDNEQ